MYRPLNIRSREIRILEILPPDFTEPSQNHDSKVAVRLKYCSLIYSRSTYEALSYTWGAPGDEALISVGSTENVPVRRNLERALKDLRYHDKPRLVWIEALCINQNDLDERREQVKLMRYIYAAATMVRSWIDLDIDVTSTAFSHLHALSDDATVNNLGDVPELWDPIGELLSNEYWSRIWVQQEIAYATKWSVHCRSSTISSACLMVFATLLVLKQWGFFTDPLLVKTRWKALLPSSSRALLYRSRKIDGKVSSRTFYGSLHRALRDCRNLKATDPRDKIFAMLGMIDGYHDGDIDVDYSFSDEKVYFDVVKLSIDHHHSLDFLREVSLGNVALNHGGFPTWLPDWSVKSTMDSLTSPTFSVSDLYQGLDELPSAPASISLRLLNMSGTCIGTVARILPEAQQESLWAGELDMLELIAKLRYFKTLADEADIPASDEYIAPDEYQSEYLFRAITGADGRSTEPWRFQIYSKMFHDLLYAASLEIDDEFFTVEEVSAIINSDPDYFGDIVHYMQESCRGRQLFVTERSGMGLVPKPTIASDEVWYILGCPAPMTLRNESGRFIVVGEAYLNDCMRWRIVGGILETSEHRSLPDYRVQNLSLH